MAGEVARYLWSAGLERQRSRDLDAVEHAADLAEAQVEGIGRVTKRAMLQTLEIHMLKKQSEELAPDGAELYTMVAIAGAVESIRVIEGVNRSRRNGR